MRVYHQTPADEYIRYYKAQAGSGQSHPGINTYRGSHNQTGNGLGSIFQGLLKYITPLLSSPAVRSTLNTASNSALKTGLNVGYDLLQGQDLGQSLKNRGKEDKTKAKNKQKYSINIYTFHFN